MKNDRLAKLKAARGLSNRGLAELLRTDESSISKWLKGKTIPDYISLLIEFLIREHDGDLEFPIKLSDIVALSRTAAKRGVTVEEYLIELIRKDNASNTGSRIDYLAIPTPATTRLNEGEKRVVVRTVCEKL